MPACWEEAEFWHVQIAGLNSQISSKEVPRAVVLTELKPGGYMAITSQAVFPGGESLPLGTVWPFIKSGDPCELDAPGGFCAELAKILMRWKFDISVFNWQRLYNALCSVEADYWDFDLYALARAIQERAFRLDMVTRNLKTFLVALPGQTEKLYPASPNKPMLEAGARASLGLASGTHTWFCGSTRLTVLVDSKGRATISY